ncbi:MAG: inorganic diphosphatase, partial [Clostridia bacterium]|nr:inorganic diphosphatase [Clostridia bacterium]
DQGAVDEKIIAVCAHDPFYNIFNDISDLPTHVFEEIRHFYAVYKTLENKDTLVKEILGLDAAREIIEKAISAYGEMFPTQKPTQE